jgi:hypothetical protein
MRLSDHERDLLPSDDEVRFYQEHGYYFSRKIYSDEEIDRALAGSERYYAGERDNPLPEGTRFFPGWKPEMGDVLRKNDYASLQNRELSAIVRKPILGAIAARLSGSPVIRLWHDQLLYKPVDTPDKPANVGWHTDRGYWKTCTSTNMITAWIPFHDCDEQMGTIMMIDGSHRWPDNTEKLNFFSHDLEGLEKSFDTGGNAIVKVPANLRKGCVSFHHCLTIHGSGPNRSTQPRRSIAVHMQDQSNRYQEQRRADGSLAFHYNDKLCRKESAGHPDYTDPAACPVLWEG